MKPSAAEQIFGLWRQLNDKQGKMRLVSLLLILGAPLLEIGLLIKVGQVIGFWWTMAIVVGTGVLGTAVLMENGLSAASKMQESMQRGEPPVGPMFDSAMTALGAMLLISPGLIADCLGGLLLIPPLRRLLSRVIARSFFGNVTVDVRTTHTTQTASRPFPGSPTRDEQSGPGPVIEGEYERLEEHTFDPNRRKQDPRDKG